MQRGEANEKTHFAGTEPSYFVMSRSKKVLEFPITPATSLGDMLLRLQADKSPRSSAGQPPIYITEDFTLTEADDRPRAELRGHLKRMQKQRLMADGDFVCQAHMVRFDSLAAVAALSTQIRQSRSELDRLTVFAKRFLKSRRLLAEKLTLEGVTQVGGTHQMLEDVAKIKLVCPKAAAEATAAMEKHAGTRKFLLQQFAQLLLGQITLRGLL